jgi:hypothetical protein
MFLFLTVQKHDKVYLFGPTESDMAFLYLMMYKFQAHLYMLPTDLHNLMWFYLYLIFQLKEMLLSEVLNNLNFKENNRSVQDVSVLKYNHLL